MSKKLFIDSINDGYARLLYGEEEFVCPASLLPKAAKEGDVLTLTFEIDRHGAAKAKKECEELLDMLLENSGK